MNPQPVIEMETPVTAVPIVLHLPTEEYPVDTLDFLAVVGEPAVGLCGARRVPYRRPFPPGTTLCLECVELRFGLDMNGGAR